jgi:hypothetical protein
MKILCRLKSFPFVLISLHLLGILDQQNFYGGPPIAVAGSKI